jgi:hypothetical protein
MGVYGQFPMNVSHQNDAACQAEGQPQQIDEGV